MPPQRTNKGPQRTVGIYVDFDSPSIIGYLEPLTREVFTTRFADCHLDERVLPPLKGGNPFVLRVQRKYFQPPAEVPKLTWYTPNLSHLDPRTSLCETEVERTSIR